ncbi:hypothetical protein FM996_05280 [Methylosinus sporium]|uniref:SPW repeat-containing integral membrane domain-containing protein n=1 Tax=Methylosinus sporium TaxID=428 RepID=A0A549T2U6_METSR|nr:MULTISPECIES: SPW repeat protein [Methylosinus]MBU3889450.1 SPW repeat protein [Methylosinus sp. KRF6]TRL36180.1 hypothetical protein FM996_05280 [Methylosinus sporium]
MPTQRISHTPDWSSLAVAAILLLAPWILHYTSWMATLATSFSAVILLALSAVAFAELDDSETPEYLIVGVWLVISPWMLGFWPDTRALLVHLLFGGGLVAYVAWEIWGVSAFRD